MTTIDRIVAMTNLQVSVCGQSESVAAAAELLGHGCDEADLFLNIRS